MSKYSRKFFAKYFSILDINFSSTKSPLLEFESSLRCNWRKFHLAFLCTSTPLRTTLPLTFHCCHAFTYISLNKYIYKYIYIYFYISQTRPCSYKPFGLTTTVSISYYSKYCRKASQSPIYGTTVLHFFSCSLQLCTSLARCVPPSKFPDISAEHSSTI